MSGTKREGIGIWLTDESEKDEEETTKMEDQELSPRLAKSADLIKGLVVSFESQLLGEVEISEVDGCQGVDESHQDAEPLARPFAIGNEKLDGNQSLGYVFKL